MSDKYINEVGLRAIKYWIEDKFATRLALNSISEEVDELIEKGGEPNTIETISANNIKITPDSQKNVDIPIPTALSEFTNDTNFQTNTQVDAKISAAISSSVTIKGSVATFSDLPATGNKNGDMYDVLDTGRNYVWIVENGTGRWDDYAGTIDMSAYWTSTADQTNSLLAMTNAEVMAILEPSA